jgi:hypothetical protein
MHHVWPHIQHALPWLSVESLLVMRHLLTSDRPGTSEAVARQLGLLNRFRLARILNATGYLPFIASLAGPKSCIGSMRGNAARFLYAQPHLLKGVNLQPGTGW